MEVGDTILNIAGPLGNPSIIKTIFGSRNLWWRLTAAAYPITKALKDAGNTTVSIVGARNQSL
jgi:hypothetical protein